MSRSLLLSLPCFPPAAVTSLIQLPCNEGAHHSGRRRWVSELLIDRGTWNMTEESNKPPGPCPCPLAVFSPLERVTDAIEVVGTAALFPAGLTEVPAGAFAGKSFLPDVVLSTFFADVVLSTPSSLATLSSLDSKRCKTYTCASHLQFSLARSRSPDMHYTLLCLAFHDSRPNRERERPQ